MKLVRESLQNFDRGVSVKHGLGVGSYALIKKWFEEFAPDVEYEIRDGLKITVMDSIDLADRDEDVSLPDNLTVLGQLNLMNSNLNSLPDNLNVKGGLYLNNTKITSLPDNLIVGGGLDLENTNITSLPDNLSVGSLDVEGLDIASLPNNLTIKEDLYLRNTKITSLPADLSVGGDVYLTKKTRECSIGNRSMIKGKIYKDS